MLVMWWMYNEWMEKDKMNMRCFFETMSFSFLFSFVEFNFYNSHERDEKCIWWMIIHENTIFFYGNVDSYVEFGLFQKKAPNERKYLLIKYHKI